MSTYRERRLARAERLRGWADARQERAVEQLNSFPEIRHDIAFITQPGRIPFRDRMNRADERAFRSMEKAERMTARADAIERQADHAIYTDDADAPERLREKIATLSAERDRWTAYNKACRKAKRATAEALELLDERQRAEVASLARIGFLRPDGGVPPYQLSNLGATIRTAEKRLEWIERGAEKLLTTRYAGECSACGEAVPVGVTVAYSKVARTLRHYPRCSNG